jgi:hypothetical protein
VTDELEKVGILTLADKGYHGSTWAKTPYKGKASPSPRRKQTAPTPGSADPASAQTPSSSSGRSSSSYAAAPRYAGTLAKAIHALILQEAKADERAQ